MNLIGIYCLCSLIIVATNSICQHFLSIKMLIGQINARQVVFLNRGDHQKQLTSNESSFKMENWIYSSFARQVPCVWIDIEVDDVPVLLQKSNSLFFYIGMEGVIDVNFVKNLKGLTLNFPAPIRVMLIMFGRKNDFSLRYLDLLKLFWQEQLVDVTIISMSPKVCEYRHKIATVYHETDYAASIHYFNPFTSVYTNRVLDSSSRLFPAKLDDLNGHRLRVGFYNDPPFSWRSHESLKINGFVGMLLEMLQLQLNFSVELDFLMDYPLLNNTYSGPLVQIVSNRRLDVFAAGAFLVHVQEPYQLERTTFITFERACGLVPLLKKTVLQLSRSIQWSLLLILSLVAIVWLSSLLLLRRGDASSSLSYWRPLDISLVMMGASVPARVVTLRERLLFGCVLVLGLFYSSTIVAHLTSLNLDLQAHKKFETYRDLDKSGLIPFVNPYTFNMTFRESNDPTLHRLGKKAYQSPDVEMCLGWLLDHANVSCIFAEKLNSYLLALHNGRMKQAEPCFWSAYRTFIMRQGSPYTLSFNRIIRVAQESGIFQNIWQRFYEAVAVLQQMSNSNSLIEGKSLARRLGYNSYWSVFFLLLAGYLLSLAVFFLELIVKHVYAKLSATKNNFN